MNEAPVNIGKRAALQQRMVRLGILERDLVEKFILGSGHGGQKLNKTSSCVYLCHPVFGLEVKCGRSRSRELNRFIARRELCDRLEARRLGAQSVRQQEAARIRRQKRRRSRRQKERLLADKHHHSEKKQSRTAPSFDE
ncbi:MAG: peptide chain release factor-like protein [Verrucomicrobia bacterium]|nr:peptide chain release factor-like protein [Verrucomicrobiota bacterium]MBU4291909.1 peptide chain release factor-like protein [Verrucomicrobiota bacterium]MBU4497111.1 peptide chain release factor-like protein [Verrucomicrobiota bacterium]MCG2679534.1 peptide chain release factor-like protein [Kiritimatiellia bacterium]